MFSEGADNINLSGSVLSADIPDERGRKRTASIDLNDCIGRDEHGQVLWGGKNVFDAYSEDFCGLEEGDDGPILHLMLQTDRGFTRSKLPLDQRITARDGKLLYS